MQKFRYSLLILLILLAVFGLSGCFVWPGGPEISKRKIPGDIPEDIKADIIKLYSWKASIRVTAAYDLGRNGKRAEPAIPFLVGMLDDDAIKRTGIDSFTTPAEAAGWALKDIGKASLDPLYAALIHKNKDIRKGAARTLRWFKEEPLVVNYLVSALDDDYWKALTR